MERSTVVEEGGMITVDGGQSGENVGEAAVGLGGDPEVVNGGVTRELSGEPREVANVALGT